MIGQQQTTITAPRRILVTGATGFVGAHVLERLLREGDCRVGVLVRPDSDRRRIADRLAEVEVLEGDLARPESYTTELLRFRPDAVVHLAWGGVEAAARNSELQDVNVAHTFNLFQNSVSAGVRHWIGLGSQAEYGVCRNRIDEDHPPRPVTRYGAAKLQTSRRLAEACRRRRVRFAWLRLFSAFGPADRGTWMIPYVIRELLQGRQPAVTRGEQLWDYLFVRDAAEAIVRTTLTPTAAGVFNLGSGHALPLRAVIQQIRDAVDPRLAIGFGEVPYREDQVMHLEADPTRLLHHVGWRAETPLAAAIQETVEWYREHNDN